MVPVAGLLPWFNPEERYHPTGADLEILETAQDSMIAEPVVTGGAVDRPKV